jgi:P pilus assembly chaperone PapD
VNAAATVPGWTRFAVAETELQQLKRSRGGADQPADLEQEFRAFVNNLPPRDRTTKSREELQTLFKEFMQWRERQGGRQR